MPQPKPNLLLEPEPVMAPEAEPNFGFETYVEVEPDPADVGVALADGVGAR